MINIEEFTKTISKIKSYMSFKSDPVTGCITSTTHFCTNSKGYIQIRYKGRTQYLHRIVCSLFHGEPSSNQLVLHSCDNRKCCNPKHLSWGYAKDNTLDMLKKQRHRTVPALGSMNAQSKLTEEIVLIIKNSKLSGIKLALKYKVSPTVISNIRLGKSWLHVKEKDHAVL